MQPVCASATDIVAIAAAVTPDRGVTPHSVALSSASRNLAKRIGTPSGNTANAVIRHKGYLIGSVFWGNGSAIDGEVRSTCSDVQGESEGVGNINADAHFLDQKNGDSCLAADSPCIDSGGPGVHPQAPSSRSRRPCSGVPCGRIDMGAPTCGIGDFVCNRIVDLSEHARWPSCLTKLGRGRCPDGCQAFRIRRALTRRMSSDSTHHDSCRQRPHNPPGHSEPSRQAGFQARAPQRSPKTDQLTHTLKKNRIDHNQAPPALAEHGTLRIAETAPNIGATKCTRLSIG